MKLNKNGFLNLLKPNKLKLLAEYVTKDRTVNGRYKIIIYKILEFKKIIKTPLGTEYEDAQIQKGFFVGVKECSPKKEFEESKECPTRELAIRTIEIYKNKYQVKDNEIWSIETLY